MSGTVKIIETRFTEDEIAVRNEHGDVEWYADVPYDDEHMRETEYDDLTAREAADLIRRRGLTFEATGNDWAADPDGSYISDYATGERTETSAHLSGFPDRVLNAIMTAVDRSN